MSGKSIPVGIHEIDSQPLHADPRLTPAVPGWVSDLNPGQFPIAGTRVVGILPGEGVGPEVMAAVAEVLQSVVLNSDYTFDIRYGSLIGNVAKQAYGSALTPEVTDWCESVFAEKGAILCGPGGSRFVYEMRARFDLFCKFTPIRPYPALCDTGVIRPEALDNVDLVVVRENTSGLYFGEGERCIGRGGIERATHTFGYCTSEVRRIIEVGIALAQRRRRRLSLVVKPGGVPAVSKLWTDIFSEMIDSHDLETTILEVDNASYQIIASAREFDVILAPNLFGDILSDNAALLLGSRGLSYSGNFGANGIATYQTGHGAAHDISGKDIANPIGQILSAAMMLRESFGMFDAAEAIETAIGKTLLEGVRTADISAPDSIIIGTREMGHRVAAAVEYEMQSHVRTVSQA